MPRWVRCLHRHRRGRPCYRTESRPDADHRRRHHHRQRHRAQVARRPCHHPHRNGRHPHRHQHRLQVPRHQARQHLRQRTGWHRHRQLQILSPTPKKHQKRESPATSSTEPDNPKNIKKGVPGTSNNEPDTPQNIKKREILSRISLFSVYPKDAKSVSSQ